MAVPWGLLTFVIGLAYGWFTPGRQNKMKLLKTGLLIGIVIAVLLALIGYAANVNPLGLGTGVVELVIATVVLVLLFVLGVWVGDLIEGATKKKRTA